MDKNLEKKYKEKLTEINREIREIEGKPENVHDRDKVSAELSIAKTKKIALLVEIMEETNNNIDSNSASRLVGNFRKELMKATISAK